MSDVDIVMKAANKIASLEQELSDLKKSGCHCGESHRHRLIAEGLKKELSTHQAMLEKMAGALDGLLNLLEHEKGTFSKQAEANDIKFAKQALEEYSTMKKGA